MKYKKIMKNLFVLLTLVLTLSIGACTTQNAEISPIVGVGNDTIMIEGSYIYTYIVDSCEYIGSCYSGFTHKGNCKFCAERQKKYFNKLDSLIMKNEKFIEELKNKNVSGSSTYSSYPYSY
jgi:hypothetical protein